jgi:hypothetical protein
LTPSQHVDAENKQDSSACPKNDPKSAEADPDLAALLDAWPTLPTPIRAGIVAMIRAAK